MRKALKAEVSPLTIVLSVLGMAALIAVISMTGLYKAVSGGGALGVPSDQAWADLKRYGASIAFVDGLHCAEPEAAVRIASEKFAVLRDRYTLSAEQRAQLDEVKSTAGGLSSNLAPGGATGDNCHEGAQLIDGIIAKMDAL